MKDESGAIGRSLSPEPAATVATDDDNMKCSIMRCVARRYTPTLLATNNATHFELQDSGLQPILQLICIFPTMVLAVQIGRRADPHAGIDHEPFPDL
jgi:hypothetical protein